MQDFADRRSATRTTQTDLRRRLSAFHRHRTMRNGIDAFIALWDDIPKYRWARLVRTSDVQGWDRDKVRIRRIAGAAVAFLFAGLAPALVMVAPWVTTQLAFILFVFTFAIALGHAVLFGLPIFLVFRSKESINLMSCVVFGFAIGAVPIGILTSREIINGVITAAGLASYVEPLIYFGLFGALGGFVFWVALIWLGTDGKPPHP